MLDTVYDNVKFIYLGRRGNISQDNLIISNNEKKACKNGDFWQNLGVRWLVR